MKTIENRLISRIPSFKIFKKLYEDNREQINLSDERIQEWEGLISQEKAKKAGFIEKSDSIKSYIEELEGLVSEVAKNVKPMLRPKRGIQPQILEDEDFRVFLMFGPNVDDEGMVLDKLKSVFIRVHSSGTSQGLIFLVDGHDDTISNAKSELRNILQQSSGKKNPLLILAIKKNLVDGLSDKDIADKLELPSLEGIKWQVQSVCTLEDEKFTKGISWLRPSIKEHEIDPTCPKERPEGKSERCKKIEEVAQENPNSP